MFAGGSACRRCPARFGATISLGARSARVHLVSVAWAAGTSGNGLEASVVFAGGGTEADFARIGSSAKGAILLVHSEPLRTWDDLFQEYMIAPGVISRAASAGAVAILWM